MGTIVTLKQVHDLILKRRDAARDEWWRELTRQGDPAHRANLTIEAFNAGWDGACADLAGVVEAVLKSLEAR